MTANKKFSNMPKYFWADIRLISQENGYTVRNKGALKIPTLQNIVDIYQKFNLNIQNIINHEKPTLYAINIIEYFKYRATVLLHHVEPKLMNATQAKDLFEKLVTEYSPTVLTPYNKQKGDKKNFAYFTGIINILIEANLKGLKCDYDPHRLITITNSNMTPLRTMSRRVDGAFPHTNNPIALWEIKEYYYTTTFGSRVADGVYETLLDGMELEELYENENVKILHYLMIDAYFTWWNCGKSYLCRMIDMLHMGYVDEILFGSEVIDKIPEIVTHWVNIYKTNK